MFRHNRGQRARAAADAKAAFSFLHCRSSPESPEKSRRRPDPPGQRTSGIAGYETLGKSRTAAPQKIFELLGR